MTDKASAEGVREQQVTFWRKFGHMIGSGVPIVETLKVIAEEMAGTTMSGPANEVAAALEQRGSVYEVLQRHPAVFSRSVIDLVRAGEAGGDLHKMALLIAQGIEQGVFPAGESAAKDERPFVYSSLAAEKEADADQGRRLANNLVLEAIRQQASDIHLEAVRSGDAKDGLLYRARFRVDGALSPHRTFTTDQYASVVSRLKVMADLDLSDEARHRPQDGRIRLNVERREFDLRVQTAPAVFGETVVVRILDRQTVECRLGRLGLSDENLAKVRNLLAMPSGLLLVSGPPGSGVTTHVYSMLSEIDSESRKVCTVEDPVEYCIAGVVQHQVDPRAGSTFAKLLRVVMRSDPDIILTGLLQDDESAALVTTAATTGHLVVSTLHASSAAVTLRKLLDLGLDGWVVADAVTGVLNCRLVRMLCKTCRKQLDEPAPGLEHLNIAEDLKSARYYRAGGCDECRGTGYRGRTAIHELLVMNRELADLVAHGAQLEELREAALASGMKPLLVDGLDKAAQGITSVEEVKRVVLAAR